MTKGKLREDNQELRDENHSIRSRGERALTLRFEGEGDDGGAGAGVGLFVGLLFGVLEQAEGGVGFGGDDFFFGG